MIYHLLSFERNADIRLKVALVEPDLAMPTITESGPPLIGTSVRYGTCSGSSSMATRICVAFCCRPRGRDMPCARIIRRALRRWNRSVCRKTSRRPSRRRCASIPKSGECGVLMTARFHVSQPGTEPSGVHGVFRIVLQLDGEEIIDAVPEIGFHHRGAEKMGERQSWHTYIPYTDRVDYLGGVMNNLPYVLAVEKLAGIEVPDRVKVMRVMMAEFFRIASHLVFYGTFAQDLGALSPVFFMFTDRERVFDIVEAICGGRMHPSWFRIGGVAQDLPQGWDRLVRDFLDYLPPGLMSMTRSLWVTASLKPGRAASAVTQRMRRSNGASLVPGLRACGFEWDFRKARPYSGYDQFEFDIPTGQHGDCYDRCAVRAEEIRQSLRIIEQCLDNMPAGAYKADHPLTTPPLKEANLA